MLLTSSKCNVIQNQVAHNRGTLTVRQTENGEETGRGYVQAVKAATETSQAVNQSSQF